VLPRANTSHSKLIRMRFKRQCRILMSVIETGHRHARSTVDHISHTLCSVGNRLLLRPQLLLGR
jgi:hypothetical protein